MTKPKLIALGFTALQQEEIAKCFLNFDFFLFWVFSFMDRVQSCPLLGACCICMKITLRLRHINVHWPGGQLRRLGDAN